MKYDCVWYVPEHGQQALELLKKLPDRELIARRLDYGISMKWDGVPFPDGKGRVNTMGHFMCRKFIGHYEILSRLGSRPGLHNLRTTGIADFCKFKEFVTDGEGNPLLTACILKPGVVEKFARSPEAKAEERAEKRPALDREPPSKMVAEWRMRWLHSSLRLLGITPGESGDEDVLRAALMANPSAQVPSWEDFFLACYGDWKPVEPPPYRLKPKPWKYEDLCDVYQRSINTPMIPVITKDNRDDK